jgi:hypothetical protein
MAGMDFRGRVAGVDVAAVDVLDGASAMDTRELAVGAGRVLPLGCVPHHQFFLSPPSDSDGVRVGSLME